MKETISTQKKLEKEGAAYKSFETVGKLYSVHQQAIKWIVLLEFF
jgi:hypothetical protein